MGDAGTITGDNGLKAAVSDTAKPLGRVHAHRAAIEAGTIKVGDSVHLAIDTERRAQIRANHSATPLLHAALRALLGGPVSQKGALVGAVRLRFDFSHPKALSADEIAATDTAGHTHIPSTHRSETPT